VLIRENFREYLDHLLHDGYSVRHDAHGSDPDLIDPGGNPTTTGSIATSTRPRSTPCKSNC